MTRLKHEAGCFYWNAYFDNEDEKIIFNEWGVTSIRSNFIHMALKSVSWGKKSPKHGDFGWLPNIPAWAKQKFQVGSPELLLYRKDKSTALKAALAEARKTLKQFKPQARNNPDDEDLNEIVIDAQKSIKAFESRIKRLSNKGA